MTPNSMSVPKMDSPPATLKTDTQPTSLATAPADQVPVLPAMDPQTALLALLTQAAASSSVIASPLL